MEAERDAALAQTAANEAKHHEMETTLRAQVIEEEAAKRGEALKLQVRGDTWQPPPLLLAPAVSSRTHLVWPGLLLPERGARARGLGEGHSGGCT